MHLTFGTRSGPRRRRRGPPSAPARWVLRGAALAGISLLAGCAGVGRPAVDVVDGDLTLLLQAPGFRSTVWVAYEPDARAAAKGEARGEAKADAAGDAQPLVSFDDRRVRTVKLRHAASLRLSLQLVQMEGSKVLTQCGQAFRLPFPSGDLRVTLAGTRAGCQFGFEHREAGQLWRTLEGVQAWPPPAKAG